jgi:DNA-binding response OmpR family regulator
VSSTTQSVLVVEDEASIASFVSLSHKNPGHEVRTATNGADALVSVQSQQPSLIVLDLMLPDIDGIEICRRIRQKSEVPILMLTARDEDVDKIIGLEVGADDYMTKPFGLLELVARVEVLLRRGAAASRLELLREVWGYANAAETRTVDTHVFELRHKLEKDPKHPRHILTVWHIGYRFAAS